MAIVFAVVPIEVGWQGNSEALAAASAIVASVFAACGRGGDAGLQCQQVFSACAATTQHPAAPPPAESSDVGRVQRDQQQQQRAQQCEPQAECDGPAGGQSGHECQRSSAAIAEQHGGRDSGSQHEIPSEESGDDENRVTSTASSDPHGGLFEVSSPPRGDVAAEAAGIAAEEKQEQKQEPIQRAAEEAQGSLEIAGRGMACGGERVFERPSLGVDRAVASVASAGKGKGHSNRNRGGPSIREVREVEVAAQDQAGQGGEAGGQHDVQDGGAAADGIVGIGRTGCGRGRASTADETQAADGCSDGGCANSGTAAAAVAAAGTCWGSHCSIGGPGRAKSSAGGGSSDGDDEKKEQRVMNGARARLPSGDVMVPATVGPGRSCEVGSTTKQEKKEQVKAAGEVPRFPRWGQHARDECSGWATVRANGPPREVDLATHRREGKALPKLKCSEALPGPKLSARFRAFDEEVASSEDSDKGEDNYYSEGDNGHFGEDGGHEHYFIGDEEGRCSGSSSTTSTARRSMPVVKQEVDLETVAYLRLQVAEAISNGGNVQAILGKIRAEYGLASVPEWVDILALQF
eukprot:CAMPEP_0203856366 /NCGR_PEP_ID=MMETSP0359-20131031/10135_1 /ASSEMBLY_ACC=CAM_ASM_000338 /TAXON_ID=268821 /ORGANISM="Scrippsiella Hangoei, Strain SHTV-5" /LENGTH=576 /DNA_ID=CAMNT_0050772967 /DNA_START=98 /DNA_END=1828 /DNA_ORIENTATION=-